MPLLPRNKVSDENYNAALSSRVAFSFPTNSTNQTPTRGGKTDTQPVTENPVTLSGTYLPRYYDHFYFRFHLVPNTLNLGNLSDAQSREVSLWNYYKEPKTITSFSLTGSTGVSVTAPGTPPFEVRGKKELKYTFSIAREGEPTISSLASWEIGPSESYDLRIIGNRTVLIPFAPNWQAGIAETLEWRTVIIRHRSGKENRSSYRLKPRRTFAYQLQLKDTQLARLENMLWGWHGNVFTFPVWTETSNMSATAVSGSTTIFCDTQYSGFRAGDSVLFYESDTNYEMAQISEVFSDRIIITDPTESTWPQGTKVVPTNTGRVETSVSYSNVTAGITTLTLTAVCEPSVEMYLPDLSYEEYAGKELWVNKKHNWKFASEVEMSFDKLRTDFGLGAIAERPTSGYPVVSHGVTLLCKTKDQIKELRGFLARRHGKRVACYADSKYRDIQLTENILSGASTLTAIDTGFSALVGPNDQRNKILIVKKDGTKLIRGIDSVTGDGNTMTVFLDEAILETIPKSSIQRISFFGLHRLGSDSVTLEWKSRSVLETKLSLTLVRP